jgi:hypothetical protein
MLSKGPLAGIVPRIGATAATLDSPGEEPIVEGWGPLTCSSSTALQPFPTFCWDVNGYYRSLGVHWRASRRQLREAYQRAGGQRSAYLTYVLKQLLDPAVRRAYDACPPGEEFLDDYVSDALRKEASCEAGRRTAAGTPTTGDQVLDERGFEAAPPVRSDEPLARSDESSDQALDSDHSEWSDDQARKTAWGFSYYLWRTWTDQGVDLRRWQELLVQALSSLNCRISFAVGVVRRQPHPYVVARLGDDWAVLVNPAEELTFDLALRAARALLVTAQTRGAANRPADIAVE